MQKLFCILTLAACYLSAGCDPCDSSCDPCDTYDTCCDPCDPCCCEPCDFVPPCPPDTCGYNAPVMIDVKCSWDVYGSITFLYMQAKEENLDYIGTVASSPNTVGPTVGSNFVHSAGKLSFDYEPAFRVGLGFNLGCDDWMFNFEYTRYHADVASGSFNQSVVNGDSTFNQSLVNAESTLLEGSLYWFGTDGGKNQIIKIERNQDASVSCSAKWRLEMDLIDFNLSRQYYVGHCLTFNTHFGLRAGWIDQTFTVDYSLLNTTTPANSENGTSKSDTESWAVGLRAGLDTDWRFCGGFYLFGNGAVSILYTDYDKILTNQTVNDLDAALNLDTQTTYTNTSRELCFLRPQANLGLGLGWSDYFCCNDWFFDFKIGYEMQVFWSQNVLPAVYDLAQDPSRLNGDLYLHGLTISARLDF